VPFCFCGQEASGAIAGPSGLWEGQISSDFQLGNSHTARGGRGHIQWPGKATGMIEIPLDCRETL